MLAMPITRAPMYVSASRVSVYVCGGGPIVKPDGSYVPLGPTSGPFFEEESLIATMIGSDPGRKHG